MTPLTGHGLKLAVIDQGLVFIVTRDIETIDFLNDEDAGAQILGALDEMVGTLDGIPHDGTYLPAVEVTPEGINAIAYARETYAKGSDDDIEIDDQPRVLESGHNGFWVAAWLWCPKPEEEE